MPSDASTGDWHLARARLTQAELGEVMDFRISLKMRAFDELQARLHAGQQVSQEEMEASYLPSAADYQGLLDWLRSRGFTITLEDRNHTTAYVRGAVSLIASELGASFGRVAKGGTEVTSALSQPSLPESVGGHVLSITGLQPHRRATRISSHHVASQLRTGTGGIAEALPGDIAASYDFPSNLDGTGQTIATVGDAVSAMSEFDYFWTAIGSTQSSSRVTIVEPPLVNNTPWPSNPTDELETALDVEWAGALAPGASLRVYFYADIFDAIGSMLNDVPAHPEMRVLSISYGGPESQIYDPSYAQTFAQLAAAGVTVLAAGGELPGGVAKEGSLVYPGSDPNVTSVGGTRDYFDSSGSTSAFGPFIFTYSPNSYGLFGPSTLFAVPAWQSPALLAAQARTLLGSDATAGRWVPDVAAFASGDHSGGGVYAFIFGASGEEGVIGTSISAPIWASVACLANQERARIGGSPMGAWMPALYGTTSLTALNMAPPMLQPTASGYYVEEIGLGRPDVAQLILCVADQFYAYTDSTSFGIVKGGISTLSARTNAPAARYQWQAFVGSGWVNLSDGPNSTLAASFDGTASRTLSILASDGYQTGVRYRALATNAAGATAATGSVTGAVTLAPSASVAVGPPSGALQPGAALTLGVNPNGTGIAGTLAYQWERNGVPIAGATDAGYHKTVTGPSDAGYYSVVVSNFAYPNLTTTVNVGTVAVSSPSTLYHLSFLAGGASGYQDATGAAAEFGYIGALAADASGNVYVADDGASVIRKVTAQGVVTTLAGGGTQQVGAGSQVRFSNPTGLAVGPDGTLYEADQSSLIRAISATGSVSSIAGSTPGATDGVGAAARFLEPVSIASDPTGTLAVTDGVTTSLLRSLTQAGAVTTLATLRPGYWNVAADSQGVIYLGMGSTYGSGIYKYTPGSGVAPMSVTNAYGQVQTFNNITGLAMAAGHVLVVADGSLGLTGISSSGLVTSFCTDAGGTLSGGALGVATDPSGRLYFAVAQPAGQGYQIYVAAPVATVTSPAPTYPVPFGTPVTMQVSAVPSAGPSSFQWLLNGVPIPGATSASLSLPSPGVMDSGDYAVAWTGANGSGTLGAGTLTVTGSDARLSNLSARAQVGTGGNVLISGFAVTTDSQSTAKNIVVTGKGPALLPLGITNYLAAPTLTFYDGSAKPIATNTGWSNNPVLQTSAGSSPLATQMLVGPVTASLSINTAGFAPPAGSADSMLTAAAPAGAYTSIVSGVGGATGVGLTEVFDADSALGNGASSSRLVNLSSRSFVGTGAGVLIAGFVIAGGPSGGPETIMLRGQGPNLAVFGLLGLLPQPTLSLYDGHSLLVASNAGWQTPPTYATGTGASPLAAGLAGLQPAPYALQMRYAGNGLPAGAADSAMVVTLPPGAYTVILSDAGGASGIGVIELYEVR